jgi:hypothetical protein
MPRPRLDESTVEAVTRLANEHVEVEAERLGFDERLRVVIRNHADNLGLESDHQDVIDMVTPYNVSGGD